MFSKRIPVEEKLGGVTGRPRRWADHSWFSTLSLARDRAAPFRPARVPVHILLRRWSPLDGAAPAGTGAPSGHPGLCRWRHRLPQDWQPRSWEPQALSVQGERSVWYSSASLTELHPSPLLVRLPPLPVCVRAESRPSQKEQQILLSGTTSIHPVVREPPGCSLQPFRRRLVECRGPVEPVPVGLHLSQHSRSAVVLCRRRSRPRACPREHPRGCRYSSPALDRRKPSLRR